MVSFTLTVSRAGNDNSEGGMVTSNPAGIDCGSICSSSFSNGTIVTLIANAPGNRVFAGWGGDCSGTEPTCTLTMDGNKTVTATFNRR